MKTPLSAISSAFLQFCRDRRDSLFVLPERDAPDYENLDRNKILGPGEPGYFFAMAFAWRWVLLYQKQAPSLEGIERLHGVATQHFDAKKRGYTDYHLYSLIPGDNCDPAGIVALAEKAAEPASSIVMELSVQDVTFCYPLRFTDESSNTDDRCQPKGLSIDNEVYYRVKDGNVYFMVRAKTGDEANRMKEKHKSVIARWSQLTKPVEIFSSYCELIESDIRTSMGGVCAPRVQYAATTTSVDRKKQLIAAIEQYNLSDKQLPSPESVGYEQAVFTNIANFLTPFSQIHPFSDGNARTAWLEANRLLLQKGFLPFHPFSMSLFDANSVPSVIAHIKAGQKAFAKLFGISAAVADGVRLQDQAVLNQFTSTIHQACDTLLKTCLSKIFDFSDVKTVILEHQESQNFLALIEFASEIAGKMNKSLTPANSTVEKIMVCLIKSYLTNSDNKENLIRSFETLQKTLMDNNYNLLLRQCCASSDFIEVIKFLLENHQNLSVDLWAAGLTSGDTAFHVASTHKNNDALRILKATAERQDIFNNKLNLENKKGVTIKAIFDELMMEKSAGAAVCGVFATRNDPNRTASAVSVQYGSTMEYGTEEGTRASASGA